MRSTILSTASPVEKPICLYDLAEFASDRLGRFRRDNPQTITERQSSLDTPDNNVDRIGKFIDEFLQTPLAQEVKNPCRKTESSDAHGSQDHDRVGPEKPN